MYYCVFLLFPARETLTMKGNDESGRISRLCAALARITASLEPETVLTDIVEGARALIGARYSMITTVDESGGLREFVTSGLSAEEVHRLTSCLPDGLVLFEYLRDQEAPLRVDDFPAHIRSLGLSPELGLCRTFQGTPIRHQGAHMGNFFVGDKEGGEGFTEEDEELLVLFASQAAGAVANARAHREERRARAGLEALMETSPVGVAVFDARTAEPASINREARRIIEALGLPGSSGAEVLGEVTSRLPDGREVTLADLKDAETLRDAEVELTGPGGRRARVLANATPARTPPDS